MAYRSILASMTQAGERPAAPVLIVDDSVVARTSIGRMVDATSNFFVAGTVGNVREALIFLEAHRVDIILLDLEMPGINGLTALPDLIAASGGARILVISSSTGEGASATVQALALGAADTLEKPASGFARRFAEVLEERLARLLDTMPEVTVVKPAPLPTQPVPAIGDFDIVAIGASTGGIHALSKLLRAIPASFDTPILITQHLPASFMPYFSTQLALLAGRPCDVAADHTRIRPGRILIAPGDAHMRCVKMMDGAVIRLDTRPMPSGCVPSVDPMFSSLGEVYGARGLCVVLSGMGRDGSIGARAVQDAGGTVIVQDRSSSVVWGMPGAVANAGGATAVLPPEEIGRLIASRKARR